LLDQYAGKKSQNQLNKLKRRKLLIEKFMQLLPTPAKTWESKVNFHKKKTNIDRLFCNPKSYIGLYETLAMTPAVLPQ